MNKGKESNRPILPFLHNFLLHRNASMFVFPLMLFIIPFPIGSVVDKVLNSNTLVKVLIYIFKYYLTTRSY